MFNLTEFRDCLERVVSLLRSCEIRFLIAGRAASIAYGDPRTTQEVVLVIERCAIEKRLEQFLAQLRHGVFLYNEQVIRLAVKSPRLFQLLDKGSSLKLCLYPYELVAGALDRAVQIEIMPGLILPVASRPDMLLSRLFGISIVGSHTSRRDVRQIMRLINAEEAELALQLATQMNLRELLDEVMAEPDEID